MFPTYEKIKELADNHGISLTKIEEDLGYSRNTLYKLKSQKPNAERVSEIADYFNVSTDYLLGRTDNPSVASSSKGIGSPSDTPQFRAIQRKAKSLSVEDQERLIQLMQLTFQDVLGGGDEDDHNF
jgi:putative repressor-phage-associated